MTERSDASTDRSVRPIVAALFGPIEPKVILAVGVDGDIGADHLAGLATERVSTAQGVAALAGALRSSARPDVIWIGGNPGWHSVREHVDVLAGAQLAGFSPAPLVVVEGSEVDAAADAASVLGRAQLVTRGAAVKKGLRLAVDAAARRLSARALWAESGGGLGVIIPTAMTHTLTSELAAMAALLDCLNRAEAANQAVVEVSETFLELLEQYENQTARLLRSRRFALGDRLVRTGRRVARRLDDFPLRQELEAQPLAIAAAQRRLAATLPPLLPPTPADALRVTYLLPKLKIAGGVLGVAQLASELRLLGVDSRVAALRGTSDVRSWRFLAQPSLFDSAEDLLRDIESCDIVVATHYTTAPWARDLVDRGRARHSAYFLQDYEPWFFPEADDESRRRVRETFGLIDRKIVKSDWLASLLQNDGYPTKKIPLGLDIGFFYPRPCVPPAHPTIIAMGRPRTPRRGFDSVVAGLARVKQARPDVEIVLFGEDLSQHRLPFDYRPVGVVSSQEHLAQLYSRATVHLDGSDFQAFGRPALEAMACGTASVLTDVGGVGEYARHEENCLLVPPRAPGRFAEAILRLVDDEQLRQQIIECGFETVLEYSMRLEARRTLAYFQEIAASAPGS